MVRTSLRTATCAIGAWLLLAPATALAAAGTGSDPYGENTPLKLPADAPDKAAGVGAGGGSLARTFIGLAIVVAVIYALSWVLRQMKRTREDRATGYGLASEASVPLGPGRSVHLIRAGRELVLVGSAEHGVVPIRTYTEDEARRLGLLAPAALEAGDAEGPAARVATGAAGLVEALRRKTMR